MEIGNDLIAGLRNQLGLCPEQRMDEQPDWQGLHSRLAAGHAAHEEMFRSGYGLAGPSGSFAALARAQGWSAAQCSRAINPNISVDGKCPAGNEAVDAGHGVTGGRG